MSVSGESVLDNDGRDSWDRDNYLLAVTVRTTKKYAIYSTMLKHLKTKHFLGIGVSMVLFGTFGMVVGMFVSAATQVGATAPVNELATGPTSVPMIEFTEPFGLTPDELGLPKILTVPGFTSDMLTITIVGGTYELGAMFSLGEASGLIGVMVGALVGVYYLIEILHEKHREAQ